MKSLEKIRMLKELDKTAGRRPGTSAKPKAKLHECEFSIKFQFASYDDLPTENDINEIIAEGVRDEFPNCTINTTLVEKGK